MLKSLFVTASGMLPKLRELEITSNNLANINTHGFKKQSIFQKKLNDAQSALEATAGTGSAGDSGIEVYTQFSQGTLDKTDNALDLAIYGEGFFMIQAEDGIYLTRNGHFQLNEFGKLVDSNGNAVLTEAGELYLDSPGLKLSESGKLFLNGKEITSLMVRTVTNPESLERVGENYYKVTDSTNLVDTNPETKILQGYLEESNVDPLEEMVKMIEIYRTFELAQKDIQAEDNNLNKLINQAGRPR
ncbi:MAG: flagellar basal-body rod protein FlgF [Calditrichia bacterium]